MGKNNILARIQQALAMETPEPTVPDRDTGMVYSVRPENLVECFKSAFEAIGGQFIHCSNENELLSRLNELLADRVSHSVASRSAVLDGLLIGADLCLIKERMPTGDFDAEIGITDCECLIARTGTILMSTSQPSGRIFPVYVPTHVVIATADQLVYDICDALRHRENAIKNSTTSAWYFVSGPSRTGDIEKTLVLGVHGPVEVIVFLVEAQR